MMAGMGKRARRRGRDHGPGDFELERWVVAALAGADRRAVHQLGAAWDGGAPVGVVLGRRLAGARSAASSQGWTEGEIERIVGKLADAEGRRALVAPTLDHWRRDRQLAGPQAAWVCVDVLRLLARLPAPPGGAFRPSIPEGVDAGVFERVRALLAKAESTTFPAEAEALSAKAHELMARHAIDTAMVGGRTRAGEVGSQRIGIDDPYAAAKFRLVSEVARASGCKAVWFDQFGLAVVFGHAADLDAVDLLHTSLLVQATTAMLAAGGGEAGTHTRSRGFRKSFLVGFAGRIGQRLRASTERVVEEAAREHGDERLLPALASREEAVEAAMRDACPDLTSRQISASDAWGYSAGAEAASRADLGGRRVDRAAAALGR